MLLWVAVASVIDIEISFALVIIIPFRHNITVNDLFENRICVISRWRRCALTQLAMTAIYAAENA